MVEDLQNPDRLAGMQGVVGEEVQAHEVHRVAAVLNPAVAVPVLLNPG
jgi:hypothetical protein